MSLRPGTRRCQCPTCKEFFRSVSGFDRHRVGAYGTGRRCLSPEEMEGRGMARDRLGVWARAQKPVSGWPWKPSRQAQEALSGGEVGKGSGVPHTRAQRLDVPKVIEGG